ncbi:MAG: hypothetical protein JW704_02905 [Anaerolineaceae bacterium]|nr:hypothetical protein [Anaerolineaceae bacterium]MBN2678085.1 hypothetical protein [Anaerolineaceae bacterium]
MNDPLAKYEIPDRKHRSQALWHIWVPFIVVFLLLAVFFIAILIVTQSDGMSLGQGRDVALILLVLPLALLGLLTFIALALTIAITSRVFHLVPQMRLLSMQVDLVASMITSWSNRLMLPFFILSRARERLSPGGKRKEQD